MSENNKPTVNIPSFPTPRTTCDLECDVVLRLINLKEEIEMFEVKNFAEETSKTIRSTDRSPLMNI